MNDLIIRQYLPADSQKVKDLFKLASINSEIGFRDGPWYHDLDTIEDFYLKDGGFVVGLLEDEIVAIAGLQKVTDTEAHIRRMRVHPDHRRKGYAQQILHELERSALDLGYLELRLRTSTEQKMAQGLYEKCGYTKMDTEKEYYAEGGGDKYEVIWYRKLLAV